MLEALVQAGASVDPKDERFRTPLHYTARRGYTNVYRALVGIGADPTLADTDGRTPLEAMTGANIKALAKASLRGDIGQVEQLLELGTPPSTPNKGGRTPLHIAAGCGNLALVALLLKAGAGVDPHIDDADVDQRWAPLDRAIWFGHHVVVKALLQAGASCQGALHVAAICGHLGIAQLLLDKGADPNQARTDGGATPLLIAAYEGRRPVVEVLLEARAQAHINERAWGGGRPLYYFWVALF